MNNSFIKKTAYAVLDLLTLKKGVVRKINNTKVRFPARWSRYYESNYEEDNYAFLRQQVKPGMHIIDIGAHIGLFSVCTSQLTGTTGKIICFEPTPGTFTILKETLRLNYCDNVIALQAAVGGAPGKATFYISSLVKGSNSNSLVLNKDKSKAEGFDVTITTIDMICRDYNLKPGLIKIDVEGAELDALKGGINTMKKDRPLFIIGLHPSLIKTKGDTLKEIWDLVKQYEYKVICNKTEMIESDFNSQTNLFDVQLIPDK